MNWLISFFFPESVMDKAEKEFLEAAKIELSKNRDKYICRTCGRWRH